MKRSNETMRGSNFVYWKCTLLMRRLAEQDIPSLSCQGLFYHRLQKVLVMEKLLHFISTFCISDIAIGVVISLDANIFCTRYGLFDYILYSMAGAYCTSASQINDK